MRLGGNRQGRTIAPLAVILVLIAYPLAVLFVQIFFPDLFAFHPAARFSLSVVHEVLSDPQVYKAAGNSLRLGLAVALSATALGSFLGYLLVRMRPWAPGMWTTLLWLLFFSPSFMIAEGVMMFAIPGGVGSGLGLMPAWLSQLIFSPVGVWAVLTVKLMPYTAIAVSAALEAVGTEYEDVARSLHARPWTRFWRVHLPLVRGAVAAGFAISFAEAVGDFGVSATLAASSHFLLIPYAIYSALGNMPIDFSGAAAQSVLLILLVLVVQMPQLALARGTQRVLHGQRHAWRATGPSPLSTLVLSGFFLVALGTPALSFTLMALVANPSLGWGPADWSMQNFMQIFFHGDAYAISAAVRSYILALLAGAATTALGIWVMWAGSRLSALYDLLLTTTIAVPGIVLAAAYVFAWNAPWVQGTPFALYGTYGVLILAYIAGGLPYSARLARVGLGQVDQGLEKAVLALGGSARTALTRVTLPLIRPLLLSTFLLTFTGAFFELPASSLLYPPGGPTLAVAIVHQFHNVDNGFGAALTVVSVLAMGVTLGLFRLVDRITAQKWREKREEVTRRAGAKERIEVVRTKVHSV